MSFTPPEQNKLGRRYHLFPCNSDPILFSIHQPAEHLSVSQDNGFGATTKSILSSPRALTPEISKPSLPVPSIFLQQTSQVLPFSQLSKPAPNPSHRCFLNKPPKCCGFPRFPNQPQNAADTIDTSSITHPSAAIFVWSPALFPVPVSAGRDDKG